MAKMTEQFRQSYYPNIDARTGVSIAEWLTRIQAANLSKHGEIVKWLKAEHGIGHSHAMLLAHDALHRDPEHAVLIP